MAIIKATNASEDIFGSTGNDVIYAYGGDDIIDGRQGNDTIYGGAGNDDIVGGSGINNLWGGSGSDWFIQSARGAGLSDDWIGDFEFGIDRIDVSAWGVSDMSQLRALLFTDSTGSATLNATYNGYDHFLTIDGVLASQLIASDFVFSNSGAKSVAGTAHGDTLFGSRYADTLNGAGGDDHLLGGLGNDRLVGGAGNDDLRGGAGQDVSTGGSGYDYFTFDAATDSAPGTAYADRITDFQEDIDIIDLAGVDARATASGNQAFAWIGAGAFTASGQLRYYFSGSDTIVAGNTDTDTAAELQIVLSGRHYMIADDFIL